jgi:hypothetical protein
MTVTAEHLRSDGWDLVDTSASRPYDFHACRGGDELYVEVKGTTSDGTGVTLTANEVDHARTHPNTSALCVVRKIIIKRSSAGDWRASGGHLLKILPWRIDSHGHLKPTAYAYRLAVAPGH